uniref:Putative homing endonuclease n=1 Tax=viral metagenome TaxID=1070528 RepID=A0A6M3JE21_9ZZZZ
MKTIPLTNSDQTAIVSDIDYDRVMQYRWMLKHNGKGGYYIARSVRRKSHVTTVHLHRFIMQPDDGYDVHHRNGNKLDCRRNNLETITHAGHAELYYGAYARGWQEYVEREYGI